MVPNQTIEQAAKELKDTTNALTALLKHENRKYFSLIIVLIIGSIVFSIFSTTVIISTCFLSGDPINSCKIIPGYKDSVENNRILFNQFRELQKITKSNQERIDQLERHNHG